MYCNNENIRLKFCLYAFKVEFFSYVIYVLQTLCFGSEAKRARSSKLKARRVGLSSSIVVYGIGLRFIHPA